MVPYGKVGSGSVSELARLLKLLLPGIGSNQGHHYLADPNSPEAITDLKNQIPHCQPLEKTEDMVRGELQELEDSRAMRSHLKNTNISKKRIAL